MKKTIIPIIADTIFIFLATFGASFAVIRFYLDSLWLCTLFSVLIGVAVAILFRYVCSKRSYRYALKQKDLRRLEQIINTLCLMSTQQLNEYFCTLFDKMQLDYSLSIDGNIILKEKNCRIFYYFTFSKTYAEKVIEFYKETEKGVKTLVIGREFNEEAISLTDRFGGRIELLDGGSLYLTMKRFECFPPVTEELAGEKKAKVLPRALVNKKNAKQYFLYGLTLIFFSFFVFYPVYYAVFGSALIVLSIICFFFGIKDEPKMQNPFR